MNEKRLAAIKAAYGDAWEKVKDFVDETGWIWAIHLHNINPKFAPFGYQYRAGSYRPIELSGLETNNGWISFEERIPEESKMHWYCIAGIPQKEPHPGGYLTKMHLYSAIKPSHFRPVEEVKPPIY